MIVSVLVPGLWTATTLSLEARTEVFRFDVNRSNQVNTRGDESGRFEILLPPGAYGFIGQPSQTACASEIVDGIFRVCRQTEPTALRIAGGEVRFALEEGLWANADPAARDETGRSARLLVRISAHAERSGDPPVVQVWSSGDGHATKLLELNGTLEYESIPISYWRAPLELINTGATLGESLTDLGVQQPILIGGAVRFYVRNEVLAFAGARMGASWRERLPANNRRLVHTESFDRADTVTISASPPGPIVGLASFEVSEGVSSGRPNAFDLVLHANRSAVSVERLRGGHMVRASLGNLISPIWAAFWAVITLATAIANLMRRAAPAPEPPAPEHPPRSRRRQSRWLRRHARRYDRPPQHR